MDQVTNVLRNVCFAFILFCYKMTEGSLYFESAVQGMV